MSLLSLEDVEFYKTLLKRKTKNAVMYAGVLQPIAEDSNYLLEYIKNLFPEYPSHNIQHSYRILNYLSSVLSQKNIEDLSDTELFCLIMAALFHDTGMALYNDDDNVDEIRRKHHKYAKKVIEKYFEENLEILQYGTRLKDAIIFACESHGETINEVYDSDTYIKRDMIEGDRIRYSVLSSFLRIGDLLDLDSNRVNRFVLLAFSKNFAKISLAHNNRHLHVENYYHDSAEINIEVTADNVEEYQIWSLWFEYIKNEILYINSYLKKYEISIPFPVTKIITPSNADFEVEELRFEIDDKGGIWKILSQSIYTDECDFIRELLQNAIDATLLEVYIDKNIVLQHQSPRSWKFDNNAVLVGLSNERQELFVIDSGIGMDLAGLKNFLFKVAGSGYSNLNQRSFPFPSIAKYGIGFVSCLINADNIEIFTSKQENEDIHYVSLTANNNLAIMQNLSSKGFVGTAIRLKLKNYFDYNKLLNYIKKCFCYPSVGIVCLDIDGLVDLSSRLSTDINVKDVLNSSFRLPNYFNMIESERKRIVSPLDRQSKYLLEIRNDIDSLIEWINANKEISEDYTDKQKFLDFRASVKSINALVSAVDADVEQFPLNGKNISEKDLFNDTQIYIDKIMTYMVELKKVIDENNEIRKLYSKPFETIGIREVSFNFCWKYCVIDLDKNLQIANISYFDEAIDLSNRTGIILLNHKVVEDEYGYEYAALNGFLFSEGKIFTSISKITGQLETRIAHTVYEKEYIIGLTNEELDYRQICEETEEMYWDEGEDVDAFMVVSDEISALVLRENNLHYLHNIHKLDISKFDFRDSLDFDQWLQREADRLMIRKKDEYIEKMYDLDTFCNMESYVLCQDGIKIPNSLNGMFPIGISKIYCNLTAMSRLPLNVTRHKISEINSEIKPWIENKAMLIQKSLLSNVERLLSNVSLEIDAGELINNDAAFDSDYLSNLLRKQFRDVIIKSKRE